MFETGGLAGKLAQADALLADVVAGITSETSGAAAVEALHSAIPLAGQVDLALSLLSERADRAGAFAADNAVSMACWLRTEAHTSGHGASLRVNIGRALIDGNQQFRFTNTKRDWTGVRLRT